MVAGDVHLLRSQGCRSDGKAVEGHKVKEEESGKGGGSVDRESRRQLEGLHVQDHQCSGVLRGLLLGAVASEWRCDLKERRVNSRTSPTCHGTSFDNWKYPSPLYVPASRSS